MNLDVMAACQGTGGMVRAGVEHGGDLPLLLAMAHKTAIATPAKGQRKSIEQDGFAGAGLASKDTQAGGKTKLKPIDQDNVANQQLREHGSLIVPGRLSA